MKLKAPPGAGDPCVAGVTIVPRAGVYDVEAETGALLIECFGFAEVGAGEAEKVAPEPAALRRPASAPKPKLMHPAWRSGPASNKP